MASALEDSGYQDSKLERVIIFLLSLIFLNLVAGVIGEMNGIIDEINYYYYYNVEFSLSSLNDNREHANVNCLMI